MAYFAQINEYGLVTQVIPVGDEYEHNGEELYPQIAGGVWKRTSFNTVGGKHLLSGTPFRYNFAQPGYTFDETKGTHGAFIPPQPYSSWILNDDTCCWEAPIARPNDGKFYQWAEPLKQWVEPAL